MVDAGQSCLKVYGGDWQVWEQQATRACPSLSGHEPAITHHASRVINDLQTFVDGFLC